MVDYSKWDKFQYDSEEDDERKPVVSRVGGSQGATVKIGPQGYAITSPQVEELDDDELSEVVQAQKQQEYEKSVPALVTASHKLPVTENRAVNKKTHISYCWKQNRYEVTIALFPPILLQSVSKKDIGMVYDINTKTISFELKKRSIDGKHVTIFEDTFRYDIEIVGDSDNPWDDVIEWSVVQQQVDGKSLPAIEFVVKKKSPIPNATIWWRNVFVGDEEIDVTKIAGRNMDPNVVVDNFQAAQQIFNDKLKAGQLSKHSIAMEDDNAESS